MTFRRSAPLGAVVAFAAAAIAGVGAQTPSATANWPSFRGVHASGVADGFALPTTWDAVSGKGVRWTLPIPGLGHSSPVIWGNRICLTTAISGAADASIKIGLYGDTTSVVDQTVHTWKLICADKATGKLLVDRTIRSGVPAVPRHTKATHANSTLATDGSYIVALLGSEGLYTFDMNGVEQWHRDLGVLDPTDPPGKPNAGAHFEYASSPILHNGIIVVQADVLSHPFLAAFDVKSGQPLWKTPRLDTMTFSTPTIHVAGATTQVLVSGFKEIAAYDLANGKAIWTLTGTGDIPVATPIEGPDGIQLFTSSHGSIGSPVYAIRDSAKGDISLGPAETANAGVVWSAPRDGAYLITPVLYKGLLYISKNNGVYVVFDARTGERHYQRRLGDGATGFTASLVAGDGKIYFTSEEGDVYVVKAGTTFELLATNPIGQVTLATPAISEGVIYFRTLKGLIAIGG